MSEISHKDYITTTSNGVNKTILIIIAVLILIVGGYFLLKGSYQPPAPAPTPTPAPQVQIREGSLDEVKAKFSNTTLADWPGVQKDQFCIDGSLIGQPELGGMGFHATKNELLEDQIIDPLNPETLLVDAEDNIVGVEYMVQSDTQPSLFGASFGAAEHPGFEIPHWDLHLWLIDNPLGTFAPFNPNLICPEGSLPPVSEEAPGPTVKEITVVGTEFSFSPSTITVQAGQGVKINFQNQGGAPHNLIVEGLGVGTRIIGGGQVDIIEFTAPASKNYTFFCSVAGHRAAGMEGSLIVE